VLSIAHDETVLARRSPESPMNAVRVIVRAPNAHTHLALRAPGRSTTPNAVLDRRLRIARAIVRAHRFGAPPERLRQLDAAYLATRMPLAEGESYDE